MGLLVPIIGQARYPISLINLLNWHLVHPIFYVLSLKKCISDPTLVVPLECVDVEQCLSYEGIPIEILDHQVRKLRN